MLGQRLDRAPCLGGCGRDTISRTGFCGYCQNSKCRRCAKCGTPIRWYARLCLACEKGETMNPPKEGTL